VRTRVHYSYMDSWLHISVVISYFSSLEDFPYSYNLCRVFIFCVFSIFFK